MDQIKMVVDSVWVESKKPLVVGVSMKNEDDHVRLSFQVTGEHYLNENYQLRELFWVSVEPILVDAHNPTEGKKMETELLARKLHAASCRFLSIKADWDGLTDRSKQHWIAIAQCSAAPDAE